MRKRPVFLPELGKLFSEHREARGWTLRGAASIAKRRKLNPPLTFQVLFRLEKGQVKNPEPDVLKALSALYNISYGTFAGRFFEQRYGLGRNLGVDRAPTTIEGFVALPLLADPIAAGQPLTIAPDPDRDRTLSFRETVVRKFTRPICLRIGPREESMLPTLEPGDVIAIDQNPDRRRSPKAGHIYAVNFGPLTGDEGGAVKRIDLSGSTLVMTSDNMDKRAYPTLVFNVTDVNVLDALVGEVVWTGRYLGSGKKADGRNMKRAGAKTR